MNDPLIRLPPQDRAAERAVLGGLLRDNEAINDVVQVIRAEDFYFDAHQKVFLAILELYNNGTPPDLVTIHDLLRRKAQLEDVGGAGYLVELWEAVPTAANAVYHARIIKDKALVRGLIHASNEILRDSYDQIAPGVELVETAERRVMEIAQMGLAGTTVSLAEAMAETTQAIDLRLGNPDLLPGVSSGYGDIDTLMSGFRKSELTILAARPGVGKTVLALNFARHAIFNGEGVFFVSLEMSKSELCERLLCCQAQVDSHRLRTNVVNSTEVGRLVQASGELSNKKMWTDDTACQGMTRISANARRLKMRHDIKLVIIDYIQLIEPESKHEKRHEQVGQISRRLKFLAKELDIPVIALSQLNRTSEDRADHKPRLADLRESGSLEQDADNVMLLFRPGMQNTPDVQDNTIEINIAKQRSGPTGEVKLTYLKQFMRFENYIPDAGFGGPGFGPPPGPGPGFGGAVRGGRHDPDDD